MRELEVSSVPVELYKVLKIDGLVGSGGEAKAVIAEGRVRLNGVVETRKRKKVVAGDVVEFGGRETRIRVSQGRR